MEWLQAFTDFGWKQWLGLFLLTPIIAVLVGRLFDYYLKIYWKHRVDGERRIALGRASAGLASHNLKNTTKNQKES